MIFSVISAAAPAYSEVRTYAVPDGIVPASFAADVAYRQETVAVRVVQVDVDIDAVAPDFIANACWPSPASPLITVT